MDTGLRAIQDIIVPSPGPGGERDAFRGLEQLRLQAGEYRKTGRPSAAGRDQEVFRYQLYGSTRIGDEDGTVGILPPGGCLWERCRGDARGRSLEPLPEAGEYWSVALRFSAEGSPSALEDASRFCTPGAVPVHRGNDGIITRIVAGEYEGILGPAGISPESRLFLDIQSPPLTPLQLEIPEEYRVLLFPLEGEALYDLSRGTRLVPSTLVRYGPGERVAVASGSDETRLLVVAYRPAVDPPRPD